MPAVTASESRFQIVCFLILLHLDFNHVCSLDIWEVTWAVPKSLEPVASYNLFAWKGHIINAETKDSSAHLHDLWCFRKQNQISKLIIH